jgi:hypothetical protein
MLTFGNENRLDIEMFTKEGFEMEEQSSLSQPAESQISRKANQEMISNSSSGTSVITVHRSSLIFFLCCFAASTRLMAPSQAFKFRRKTPIHNSGNFCPWVVVRRSLSLSRIALSFFRLR